MVVVDGKVVREGGKLVTVDEEGFWRKSRRRGGAMRL
jgi:hypothetical protein